jgi:hypothetical protein
VDYDTEIDCTLEPPTQSIACHICQFFADIHGLSVGQITWALEALNIPAGYRCGCGVVAGMHAVQHPHRIMQSACMGYAPADPATW